jgi:hypothetical protein
MTKPLTWKGQPIIQPSPELEALLPECYMCKQPFVWVRNARNEQEPHCTNPECSNEQEMERISQEREARARSSRRVSPEMWTLFLMPIIAIGGICTLMAKPGTPFMQAPLKQIGVTCAVVSVAGIPVVEILRRRAREEEVCE